MDIHAILVAGKKASGDWYGAIFDSVCLFFVNIFTPSDIIEKWQTNFIELLKDPVAWAHGIMYTALLIGVIFRSATAILKFWYTLKNKGTNGD